MSKIQYAKTKDELPKNSEYKCPICLENINLDELTNIGVPNCVICENGHRTHNECFKGSTKNECPICRSDAIKYCKSQLGYSYVPRKGGKKNKKTSKRRKHSKRRKTSKSSSVRL